MASGFIPFLAMAFVQLGYSGMNISSKLAMQSGMNPIVLAAYRQIFATLAIAPFAYCFERKKVPKLTRPIMFQILLSSLTGVTGNQVFFFLGLKYSTTTIACAMTNMLPAFTFILALVFRQEYLRIRAWSGQAKIAGTVLCVGGALVLSFYHGNAIDIGESNIHWEYAERMGATNSFVSDNTFLGPFFLIASALVWAVWFIVQADLGKIFAAPYTSTTYMCFLASFQCVVIALCFDHSTSAWSLANPIRVISALYSGVICTGVAYGLMSWTIERKGPLYVSVFTPLQLVITAFISWALLREEIYVGTVIGSLLIVLGLYSVLWGKNTEIAKKEENEDIEAAVEKKGKEAKNNDSELHSLVVSSNGNNEFAAS
ncbi:WAT1-related protein At1g09380-like [Prosopis cineraria]|uniref:WAT1-related protein At1g09380-like n=1 Tax=Prosopis cineraria TaxID=364024 RepID=UPI00240E9EC3|nr:WAT1-related protein At1g09380-like [Prosopis cineraria]